MHFTIQATSIHTVFIFLSASQLVRQTETGLKMCLSHTAQLVKQLPFVNWSAGRIMLTSNICKNLTNIRLIKVHEKIQSDLYAMVNCRFPLE